MGSGTDTYTTLAGGPINLTYSKLAMGNMSTIAGDATNVTEHRQEFFELLPKKPIVRMKCKHESVIIDVDDITLEQDFTELECDGFIADLSQVSLLMLPANCAPVVIYVPGSQIVAYAHLSRQTSTLRLAYTIACEYVRKTGVSVQDVRALIGPCVHKESYIFPAKIADELFDDQWSPFIQGVDGGKSVDLPGMIVSQLVESGISLENIFIHPDDTSSGEYFAQNKSSNPKFDGRNAAAVYLVG
jgi:copper oxidase (laccase) domain-containing protein